ncbi:uncharacterized protein LOC124196457 isoform X3 [Daphnia pulex]|uniref:uncharacterized protein LOC124196457 isoform X3 n=1 Tax=Daphnia pulex TaxID=6669 RepID=UPI001EDCD9B8|nr:uncharacterized protein LOC124196457 isoform X3 [Daphnia pulex]XP_046447518.1 uncharacterized protein LOC124196457 isoform X3 [Daphnia pulex]XP_046447519.1 uncharacterized protein LOC124196457 isoform X3 [Daphnia pulex]XP_046447520.1 uncharacterized protein LOC124196457 isoform X3 [Daphnia pulex]
MAYRQRRGTFPTSVVAVCWALLVLLMSSDVCKSQPIKKPPAITYVAGPNQLTLLLGSSSFRFGYDTDDQFRAERRFPNGTVAGYYGYMRADGKPIRVKYGAVDNLGFSAIEEIIPVTFPPPTTLEPSEEGEGSGSLEPVTDTPLTTVTETVALVDEPFIVDDAEDKLKTVLVLPKQPIVDDEKESVSIDAADYFRSGGFLPASQALDSNFRFVFPKIDVPDLPQRRQTRAAFPPPVALPPTDPVEDRRIVVEQLPGEPPIIFKQPNRFHKLASTRYTLN